MTNRISRGFNRTIRQACLPVGLVAAGAVTAPLIADIDVGLAVREPVAAVGDTVRFDCILRSESPHEYCCATIAIDWDPSRLRLLGANQNDAEGAQMAWWPVMSIPWTLNEVTPPQDGTGLYIVLSSLGADQMADADGAIVTTFEFEALTAGMAEVGLDFEGPGIEDETIVWDGVIPNMQVTGTLSGGSVTIGSTSMQGCPADLTGDSSVGVDDVLEVFAHWQDPYTVDDLVAILMSFGPCGQ